MHHGFTEELTRIVPAAEVCPAPHTAPGLPQGQKSQVWLWRQQTRAGGPEATNPLDCRAWPLHRCRSRAPQQPLVPGEEPVADTLPSDMSPPHGRMACVPQAVQAGDIPLRGEVTKTTNKALGKKFMLLYCLDPTVTCGFCCKDRKGPQ